jgi:hypothetical protein
VPRRAAGRVDAGNNLDKARRIFERTTKNRPRVRLTIRQRCACWTSGQDPLTPAHDEARPIAANIAKLPGPPVEEAAYCAAATGLPVPNTTTFAPIGVRL